MENENIYETENEKLVSDIAYMPEIEDGFKYCEFCGEKLENNLNFCVRCGKKQNDKETFEIPVKKVKTKKKKIKKINKITVYKGVSYLLFVLALIFFAAGFICMMFNNNAATISIFGSNSDELIKNLCYVTGNLLMSLICLIAGIFVNLKK